MTTYVHELRQREVFGRPVTAAQVGGELVELFVEVRDWNWEGIREEFSDVMCFLHVYVWQLLGEPARSWPAFGAGPSIAKFTARMNRWSEIFEAEGLVFHPRFLVEGSNYAKPEKVAAALAAAKGLSPYTT
jgi:hypothetical protein